VRVAHLVEDLQAVGGVPTYLGQLLPALASRGVESIILTADETLSFAGVRCLRVDTVGCDRADLTPAERSDLMRVLRELDADVAYAHVTRSAAVLETVAEQLPTVFYAHDYYPVCPGSMRYLHRSERFCAEGVGLRCFWRAYTERSTSRRPDRILHAYLRVKGWSDVWPALTRVLVASPFMADVLLADGVPPESLRIVPQCVELPEEEIGAEPDVDVVFIGRLVAAKGAHVLVRALAELEGVTASIAGDGPDRPALESLVADLGLRERVRFTGWISASERARLLASARVVAVPSLWEEPFGLVGIEALAAGVPVVASAVGGIPSWLEDGVCGILVPRADVSELAHALGLLVHDEHRRSALAAAAPGVAARFSIDRHLELLLPELHAAAAERSDGPAYALA
jgi:glycosyltransferase involved in cell wall biosynthesis